MEKAFAMQGLDAINGYFERVYKPQNLQAALADLMPEPDRALINAHDRIYKELNPRPAPPIQRIIDIVKAEGRKIRETEAAARESEWYGKKEKRSDPTILGTKQSDEYAEKCRIGLVLIVSNRDTSEKLAYCERMHKEHPGHGWDKTGATIGRKAREAAERKEEIRENKLLGAL